MKSYNGFTPAQRMAGDKILKKAIEDGIIKSPMEQACCMCGQDKGIRHLHCEDYSPNNIIKDARCLCWRCHMMLHGRYSHPNSWSKYVIDVSIYKKRFAPVYRHDFKVLDENMID